jgi:hypothetical protein
MESRRLLNEISANVETVGRPTVRGKFLFDGAAKVYARGVTYGTFAPGPHGTGYPVPSVVDADFQQMAASGINAVRTYTVPPRWLLDVALRRGLRVRATPSARTEMPVHGRSGHDVTASTRGSGEAVRFSACTRSSRRRSPRSR